MKTSQLWMVALVCAACSASLAPGEDLASRSDDQTGATLDQSTPPNDLSILVDTSAPPPDLAVTPSDLTALADPDDLVAVDATHVPTFVKQTLPNFHGVNAIAGAAGTVYFAGSYNMLYTANGGTSFDSTGLVWTHAARAHGNAVYFATDTGLYVARDGEHDVTSLLSGDGGMYGFQGVGSYGQEIVAAGGAGQIVRSSDDGAKWQNLALGTSTLGAVWVDAQAILLAVSPSSQRSTDHGAHWEPVSFGATFGDASYPWEFWGTADGTVWAVGAELFSSTQYAMIARSSDHGATWSKQVGLVDAEPEKPLFEGKPLYGVWGSSANDLWAVGHGGLVLHSTDGGGLWTPVDLGTTSTLRAVWGTSPTDIWIGGDGGVWHLE